MAEPWGYPRGSRASTVANIQSSVAYIQFPTYSCIQAASPHTYPPPSVPTFRLRVPLPYQCAVGGTPREALLKRSAFCATTWRRARGAGAVKTGSEPYRDDTSHGHAVYTRWSRGGTCASWCRSIARRRSRRSSPALSSPDASCRGHRSSAAGNKACPFSTGGGTRRVRSVREGGGGEGGGRPPEMGARGCSGLGGPGRERGPPQDHRTGPTPGFAGPPPVPCPLLLPLLQPRCVGRAT